MPEKLSTAKRGQNYSLRDIVTKLFSTQKKGQAKNSLPTLCAPASKSFGEVILVTDIQENRKPNEQNTKQSKSLFCKNWDEVSRRFSWMYVFLNRLWMGRGIYGFKQ